MTTTMSKADRIRESLRPKIEVDASVQDADEALAGAQAQLEELEEELEPLRSELKELETKIEDATASGDTDAPVREWSRKARGLRGEIEDLEAERGPVEALVDQKQKAVREARRAAAEKVRQGYQEEAAAHGRELSEALQNAFQAVEAVRAIESSHLIVSGMAGAGAAGRSIVPATGYNERLFQEIEAALQRWIEKSPDYDMREAA